MDHVWRDEWKSLAAVTGEESIREVNEMFADDFVGYLSKPDDTALSAFFQRFRS